MQPSMLIEVVLSVGSIHASSSPEMEYFWKKYNLIVICWKAENVFQMQLVSTATILM